jgi:hypothetical protein
MAQDNKTSKAQLLAKWKSLFGDVDFNHVVLGDAMVYIGPQPDDSLDTFEGKKLEGWVRDRSQEWLNQFFKRPFHVKLDTIMPKKYYLPRKKEAGFLRYEWSRRRYHFTVYESYNGYLFNIRNDSIANFPQQSAKQFAALMTGLFNLRSQSEPSVLEEFDLRERIAPGLIFTNVKNVNAGLIRDWQDYLVGFITRDSICIICFKSTGMRAEAGLRYVSDWLGKAIHQ